MNFNRFYLTHYTQNIIISTCNQYKNHWIFIFLVINLQNPVSILHLQNISIWTSHISSGQKPPVANGYYTGQHGSNKEALPSFPTSLSPDLKIHMNTGLHS